MTGEKEYLTTKEAQAFCDCSRSTLEKARQKGILHTVKGCKVRYSRKELHDWITGKLTAPSTNNASRGK